MPPRIRDGSGMTDVIIVYTRLKPASEEMALSLADLARSYGAHPECLNLDEVESRRMLSCDFLVVLGGDGTILGAIHHLEDPETPVLAVSYGRGGFLAESQPENAHQALSRLLSGSYHLERYMRISVDLDGSRVADAVNEAYISNSQPGKVIEYSISIDGVEFPSIVGDGLIVATPLGSTAYSMSSGGPAVDDSLECIIATPVLPITHMCPLILSPSKKLDVAVKSRDSSVLIDGRIRRLFKGGEIGVRRSPTHTVLVRTGERGLFEKRVKKRLR